MRAAVLVVVLFGLGRIAYGQVPDAQTAEGKERFRHGTQFYDLGKYAEAASEYEAAFGLTDRPALLFNIGQAHRLAGNRKAALAAYQGFLRRVPDSPQRAEVEEHIATLEKEQHEADERARVEAERAAAAKAAAGQTAAEKPAGSQEAAGQNALTATASAKPERKKSRAWAWGVVAGVVVVGVAVGLGVGLGTRSHPPSPTDGTITF